VQISPPRRPRSFPALYHRDYLLFWVGGLFTAVGQQFTTVAMSWQIYELTNSALQIGLLGLSRGIPQMILLLFGGVLADAVDRRKLMMTAQVAQLVVALLLLGTTVSGLISPGVLYAAGMLLAVTTALENPVRNAIMPNLVPREDLGNAAALFNAQRNFGQVAGPALGGVALATAGPGLCYGVNAASWLVMIGALFLIQARPESGGGRRAVTLQSFREGIGFVWSSPVLLIILCMDFVVNFFGSPRALLPIFARDILEVGPQGLGILYASVAVGALATGAFVSWRKPVQHAGLWVILGMVIFGLANALFSISHEFWFSIVMLAISGVGDSIAAIQRNTINQLVSPDALRGRVNSVNSVFSSSGPQLGQFQSGAVAAWWGNDRPLMGGAEFSGFSGGIIALIVALGVLAHPRLRDFQIVDGRPFDPHASPTVSSQAR
jgi:MFS family permease